MHFLFMGPLHGNCYYFPLIFSAGILDNLKHIFYILYFWLRFLFIYYYFLCTTLIYSFLEHTKKWLFSCLIYSSVLNYAWILHHRNFSVIEWTWCFFLFDWCAYEAPCWETSSRDLILVYVIYTYIITLNVVVMWVNFWKLLGDKLWFLKIFM